MATLSQEPASPVEPAAAAEQSPYAAEEKWQQIPHLPLGEGPDLLPEEDSLHYRQIIAKRALLAAYEESDLPHQCVQDLLSDLRHLCDALGLDFAALDRGAYANYAAERDE